MTDRFKRHGETDKNVSRHMTLTQEMESYPIMIEACANNKDDHKESEDT